VGREGCATIVAGNPVGTLSFLRSLRGVLWLDARYGTPSRHSVGTSRFQAPALGQCRPPWAAALPKTPIIRASDAKWPSSAKVLWSVLV
jgi:hypothetical protein